MNRMTTIMNSLNNVIPGDVLVVISLIIVLLIIAGKRIVERCRSQI